MRRLIPAVLALCLLAPGAASAQGGCGTYVVTAYSRQQFPGIGYGGGRPVVGQTAAASWNVPLGTTVWIEGYGERVINDRGQLGNTGHIDLFVETTAEALQVGRQRLLVCW